MCNALHLPQGLSIDSATGLITGTIANAAPEAVYPVTLTASDGANTASQTFNWTVTHVFVVNPGDQTYAEGQAVTLPIVVDDHDGSAASSTNGNAASANAAGLTYSVTGLPAGLALVGAEIAGTIAPSAVSATPYNVLLRVTDSLGITAQVNFLLNVLTFIVTFFETKVVAGYLKGANGAPVDLPNPAEAAGAVSDVFELPNIRFAVSGHADRISLGQIRLNLFFNTFAVQVNGRSATPAMNGGVTTLGYGSQLLPDFIWFVAGRDRSTLGGGRRRGFSWCF